MSTVPFNRLSTGIYPKKRKLIKAISEVIDSGQYINGPSVTEFESKLATFTDSRHAVGVANGSDALEIAMRALGLGLNSTIGIVANAGGYALVAARNVGCKIVFIDILEDSALMSSESLSEISSRVHLDAIVLTYLYGNTHRTSEVFEVCDRLGIPVIEDCAQAIGAKVNNRIVGSLGNFGTFSFYPTKNLGAIGDGGAITTNNEIYASRLKSLRQYGWGSKYSITMPEGRNSRLDEIQAKILLFGFQSLEKENSRRREIASIFNSAINSENIKMITEFNASAVAHLCVLKTKSSEMKEVLIDWLNKSGVETSVHYPVLDSEQNAGQIIAAKTDLPNTLKNHNQVVSLPCYPSMTSREVNQVAKSLSRAPI